MISIINNETGYEVTWLDVLDFMDLDSKDMNTISELINMMREREEANYHMDVLVYESQKLGLYDD